MKQIRAMAVVGLLLMVDACGSRQPLGINGSWFAAVNNPDQSSAYQFTATLAQASGTTVNVTNFIFTNSTSCFSSQGSETATFSVTGSSNGIVTGTFTMTISTVFPALNNVLTLQGNRDAVTGEISGTWTLTGQSGCTGNGNFTMNQPHTDRR